MIKSLKYFGAIALFAGLSACETELNVNGEYNSTAVVYCLLDPTENVHLLNINKTYLGNGSAFDFAQIGDSMVIPNLKPVVTRYFNGKLDITYPVYDTIITGRPSGTFYNGPTKAYYFRDGGLSSDAGYDYRLSFELNGQTVSAKTVITDPSVQKNPRTDALTLELINSNVRLQKVVYNPLNVQIETGKNTRRSEFQIKFTYTEEYMDGSKSNKTIDLSSSVASAPNSNARNILSTNFDSSILLNQIKSSILVDPNVKQRILGDIIVEIVTAGEDLSTYIEVNNPVTAVLQERPEFTNVNNGVGIMSSRHSQVHGTPVGEKTSRYRAIDPEFNSLKFCSTNPKLLSEGDVACQP